MIRAGVVGASGYSGLELVRLLLAHPDAEPAFITSTSYIGQGLSDIYPGMTGVSDLKFTSFNMEEAAKADLVFVALPHGESMKVVGKLFRAGIKAIDISGDCRLPADLYRHWYKREHTEPELPESAIYGLTELNRESIAKAKVIANPGCYPTGVILAAAPLLAGKAIEPNIIANCLSGISGAGRAAGDDNHFCQADENVSVYKVGGLHQHIPEMELGLEKASGFKVKVAFTPHLAPFSRGIFSTVYAPVKQGWTAGKLHKILADFYRDELFVHVLPEGRFPQVKSVAGTNFCHIGVAADERTGQAVVISAIDNLGKGAAGQAVQNMNLMLGIEEARGLMGAGLYP